MLGNSDLHTEACHAHHVNVAEPFVAILLGHGFIEGWASLLDLGKLNIRVGYELQVVAPVCEEHHSVFCGLNHIDDTIVALGCLDDEFEVVLADINGEVG